MMIIIKVIFLWTVCFYISIIIAALIKGVKLNMTSIKACIISPLVCAQINSKAIKTVCKYLYKEKHIIVTNKNSIMLNLKVSIFTFPDFLSYYFDFIKSIESSSIESASIENLDIESKTKLNDIVDLKHGIKSNNIDRKLIPYKNKIEDKLLCIN